MREIFLLLLAFVVSAGDLYAQLVQVVSGTNNGIGWVKHNKGQVYFLGNNYFSKTSDLGQTIQSLNVPLPPPNEFPPNNNNLARALNITEANDIYLIIGKTPSWIIHSGNEGISWDTIFYVPPWYPSSLDDITVNKNGVMLTICSFGKAFKSKNGITWDTIIPTNMITQNKCIMLSDTTFLITGQNDLIAGQGRLIKPWYHNGVHLGWKSYTFGDTKTLCTSIQVITEDTVYMSWYSGQGSGASAFFSKSFDGGESWTTFTIGLGIGVNDIAFTSSNHGLAVGYDHIDTTGIILETNDAGATWSIFKTGFRPPFWDIKLIKDSLLFIGGSDGLILKSGINSYATSVNEVGTDLYNVRVFPNPVKDKLNIQLRQPGKGFTTVRINNILGEQIAEYRLVSETEQINISHLVPGIYFLEIIGAQKSAIIKIIKE